MIKIKIAVIGYSGAGKSTLSKKLSNKYDCPLLYLDKVNFIDNWQEREPSKAKEIVKEFMKKDSWVIDGNYRNFYQEDRFKDADKIIFLNFSRKICLFRAFRRFLEFKNKVRESTATGCIEKLDFEFIKWILIDGRTKERREHYEKICNTYKDKIIICKSPKQVRNLLI